MHKNYPKKSKKPKWRVKGQFIEELFELRMRRVNLTPDLGVKPDGVKITPHLINYSLYRVKVTPYLE